MTDPKFYRSAGVFDAVRPGLQTGAGLLVEDGRVAAVGPPDEACPPGVRQVDLGDVYLVPGFVDAHTHVTIRPGEGNQHWQLVQAMVGAVEKREGIAPATAVDFRARHQENFAAA